MSVKLVWVTPNAETEMGYCARVSNPANQNNPSVEKLLSYCAKNGHWSVFEMANACLEITTSRAISAQIARHRSFSFQEFSQRYAKVQSFEKVEFRKQDDKNRQNSLDNLDPETKSWAEARVFAVNELAERTYEDMLAMGIAKECARMVLPMSSTSRMYMNGTIRSWIHYIGVRTGEGTQKEHRDIAIAARDILAVELPVVARAVGWVE